MPSENTRKLPAPELPNSVNEPSVMRISEPIISALEDAIIELGPDQYVKNGAVPLPVTPRSSFGIHEVPLHFKVCPTVALCCAIFSGFPGVPIPANVASVDMF